MVAVLNDSMPRSESSASSTKVRNSIINLAHIFSCCCWRRCCHAVVAVLIMESDGLHLPELNNAMDETGVSPTNKAQTEMAYSER
jgi:hypothetical protein